MAAEALFENIKLKIEGENTIKVRNLCYKKFLQLSEDSKDRFIAMVSDFSDQADLNTMWKAVNSSSMWNIITSNLYLSISRYIFTQHILILLILIFWILVIP
jgi:hypothetical protein